MKIKIGGEEFEPRRESYELLLSQEDLDEREAIAVDEVNLIAVEQQQTRGRLATLAEGKGEFDAAAAAALREKLTEVRQRARVAGNALLRVEMESVAQRLEPVPEVDFLLANLTPEEFADLREQLNEARPTRRGSPTESAES